MSFLKITTAVTLGMAMSIGTALAAYPEKPVKLLLASPLAAEPIPQHADSLPTCTKHQA